VSCGEQIRDVPGPRIIRRSHHHHHERVDMTSEDNTKPDEGDVEGHAHGFKGVTSDDDDVEGHAHGFKGVTSDDDDDVEGHAHGFKG
jgi:hypothetical protein